MIGYMVICLCRMLTTQTQFYMHFLLVEILYILCV
jgi:hypothetical protein